MRRSFGAASVAWAAALPAAAWGAGGQSDVALRAATALVHAAGAVVCHQRPDRSFHLWNAPLPVCARCTGIYLAAAVVAIAVALLRRHRRFESLTHRAATASGRAFDAPDRTRWLAVAAVVPTVLTLVWEWTFGVPTSNAVRAVAGLPIGAAVSWLVLRSDSGGGGVAGHGSGRLGQSG